jgi:hypothetical protein
MDSFIESDTSGLTAAESQRTFNFSSPEGNSQQFKEVVPMIAKRSLSTEIITKRFKLVSAEGGKPLHDHKEQNLSAISIEKQDNAKNYGAVRYKLLAPAAAANSKVSKNPVTSDQIEKNNRVIYLLKTPAGDKSEVTKTAAAPQFVASAAAVNSEVSKNAVTSDQIKKSNQVIYLLKTPTGDKSEVKKTAASHQFSTPAVERTKEQKSFKFSKGEAGKVVKHKKTIVKKVEILAQTPVVESPAAQIEEPKPAAEPAKVKVQTNAAATTAVAEEGKNDDKSIVIDLSNSSK